MPPELSVVILCYRAGRTVEEFIKETVGCLDAETLHWEIVLVGNYLPSTDDLTPQVVRQLAERDDRIRAVTKVKEGMMGWDVRSGFAEATGDVMALIDGDGQMTGQDIVRAYRVLEREPCDMVVTYRVVRHDGAYRYAISRVYNLVFRMLFGGLNARDINSKPKLMTRSAYNRLHLSSDDWFVDAEIMIQARRLRFKVQEIPVTFHELKTRKSFVRLPAVIEFIRNLAFARIREFRKR